MNDHRQNTRIAKLHAEPLEWRRLLSGLLFNSEIRPVGFSVRGMESGDINDDGHRDVVIYGLTPRVAVLFGQGDGTFQPMAMYPLFEIRPPLRIDVADLNNDGADDIVGINSLGELNVLLGSQSGGVPDMLQRETIPVSSASNDFALGYFDADAHVDLVVRRGTTAANTSVAIWRGNGDGTFVEPADGASYAVPEQASIYSGDLDGDGLDEVIGMRRSSSSSLWVLRNHVTNGFSEVEVYAPPSGHLFSGRAVIADVTGDGRDDVMIASSARQVGHFVLYRSASDGSLMPGEPFRTYNVNARLVAGDVNGDGWKDVVAVETASGISATYLGASDGSLTFDALILDGQGWGAWPASDARLLDINNDGKLDLLSLESDNDTEDVFYTLLGDGSGHFLPDHLKAKNWSRVPYSAAPRMEVMDVDGDGLLDVVNLSSQGQTVAIAYGKHDGTFSSEVTQSFAGLTAADVQFADFDADGRLDIVYVSNPDRRVHVQFNLGNRAFGRAWVSSDTYTGPRIVAVGDLNRDGLPDLVAAGPGPLVSLSNGDGTFTDLQRGLIYWPGATASHAQLADVTGDGHLDLVVLVGTNPKYVGYLPGNGDGTFRVGMAIEPSVSLQSKLQILDIDADSDLEILVSRGSVIDVFEVVDGQLVYQRKIEGLLNDSMAIGDVTGDGVADIIIVEAWERYLKILAGRADGTFDVPRHFSVEAMQFNSAVAGLAIGDVTNDGRSDIVMHLGQFLAVLESVQPYAADTLPPVVTLDRFDVTGREIAAVFRASEPLDPKSVDATDLVAQNLTTGEMFHAASVVWSTDRKTVRFVLPRSMADGDYALSFAQNAVSDFAGNGIAATTFSNNTTFILAGDANRDRVVNFDDLLIVAQNYGQVGKTFSQGNINYDPDGRVDFDDLLILAQRYGTSLAIVAEPAKPTTSAKRRGETPGRLEI